MKNTGMRLGAAGAALGLALLASGCAGGGGAEAEGGNEPVDLMVDWTWGAKHIGYIVADEQGYFEEEGVDVTLHEGKGSASVGQLVATGEMDFGVMTPGVAISGISKGLDVTTVATQFTQSASSACYNADTLGEVDSIDDLAGHKFGNDTSSAGNVEWEAAIAISGADRTAFEEVDMAGDALVQSLVSGTVDAIFCFPFDQGVLAELEGTEVGHLPLADIGLDVPGTGVVVNNGYLEDHPEATEAVVRAVHRGWEYTRENPEEALDIFLEAQPRANAEYAELSLPMLTEFLGEPGEYGKMDPAGWDRLIEIYDGLDMLSGPVTTEDAIDTTFIDQVLSE